MIGFGNIEPEESYVELLRHSLDGAEGKTVTIAAAPAVVPSGLKLAEKAIRDAIILKKGHHYALMIRKKNEPLLTDAKIAAALKQYDDAIIEAQRNYTELKRHAAGVGQAKAAQSPLLGLGKPAVEIKVDLKKRAEMHIASVGATIIKLVELGIPIDVALSTVKKEAKLNAEGWKTAVAQAQYKLQIFTQTDFSLNGPLGNPALAQAGKQAAMILAPIILEEVTRFAKKKYEERQEKGKDKKGKKGRKTKLGAVEVLDQNAKSVGVADDYSYDGKPINFGGFVPKYQVLSSYDHLIKKADGLKKYHGDKGLTFVLDEIKRIEKACRGEVSALARHLYHPIASQAAMNIWHFCKKNMGYSLEEDEQLRTPARSWADRHTKIDCDDFAIFCAAILNNMGYAPKFRVVAFNNKPNFQHIYVTVNGVVLDPVLDYFGSHPKNITNAMDVYTLSGVPSGTENKKLKIERTKAALLKNIAIARAKGDQKRVRVFRHILSREHRPEFLPLAGLAHLIDDVDLNGIHAKGFVWRKGLKHFTPREMELVHSAGDGAALGEVENVLCCRDGALHGLGRLSSEEIAKRQQKRWDKVDKKRHARQQKRLSKMKNPKLKAKAEKRINKANQRLNERREANKGVSAGRRVGRAFARFEPLAATGRASFIAVVKLNFRGLATNMSWAVLPDDILKKNGLSDAQIKEVRTKWAALQKRWADLGGNPGVLRDAILKGYKKKPLFGQGKKGKAKRPKHLSGLSGADPLSSISEKELGSVLALGAGKGYLNDVPGELFGLGAVPAIAAAITAAAAIISAVAGMVSGIVKAAGKRDAGEVAEQGGEVEIPSGEAPQVSEEELYDGAFPEDTENGGEEEPAADPEPEEAPAEQQEMSDAEAELESYQ